MAFSILLATVLACQVPPPPHGGSNSHAQKGKKEEAKYLPGDHDESVEENGAKRSFIVHVPLGYDGKKKLPLVMLLHGWTATAQLAEEYTQMGVESDKAGFLLVLPEGSGKPEGWNCGFLNLGAKDSDDVKFLTDVLDAAEKKVKVDKDREYIAGHSNGGMMAYVMGAKLSERVAAIGVVSGTIGVEHGTKKVQVDPPRAPVSAIILHGRFDPTVPYEHGPGLLSDCISAPDSAAFWAKADGLLAKPTETKAGNGNLLLKDWKAGPIEVLFVTIENGKHDWPGGLGWDGPETVTGVNAADLLWGFFRRHRRDTGVRLNPTPDASPPGS